MGANISTANSPMPSYPSSRQLIAACNHELAPPPTPVYYPAPPPRHFSSPNLWFGSLWGWSLPRIASRCGRCGCWWHGGRLCDCGCGPTGPLGDGFRVRGTFGGDDVDLRIGGKDNGCKCCDESCSCKRTGRARRRKDRSRSRDKTRDRRNRNFHRRPSKGESGQGADDNDDDDRSRPPPHRLDYTYWEWRKRQPTRARVDILEDNVENLKRDFFNPNNRMSAIPSPYVPPGRFRTPGGRPGLGRAEMGSRPQPRRAHPHLEAEREFFDEEEDVMSPTDNLRMAGAGRIGVDPRQPGEGMFRGRSQKRQAFHQSVPQPDTVRRSQAVASRRRPRQAPFTRRQPRTPEQDPRDDRFSAGGPADDSDRPPEDDNDPNWEDASDETPPDIRSRPSRRPQPPSRTPSGMQQPGPQHAQPSMSTGTGQRPPLPGMQNVRGTDMPPGGQIALPNQAAFRPGPGPPGFGGMPLPPPQRFPSTTQGPSF